MPLRDHLDKLALIPFFSALSTKEQKALDEFNQLYLGKLNKLLEAKLQQQLSLINKNKPNFFKSVSLESFRETYKRLLVERDDYKQPGSASISQDYTTIPPDKRTPPIEIDLPDSVKDLSASSLIRLAFAPQGYYFYHYLNQYINDAIRIQADQYINPSLSNAEFYRYLNSLDNPEFDQAIKLDYFLSEQGQAELPLLYTRLVKALVKLGGDSRDLACTDGKAVEFLGGRYLQLLLEEYQTGVKQKPEHLTAEIEGHLLELAAKHGSYEAAFDLADIYLGKLKECATFTEVKKCYEDFLAYWPDFSNQYKAVGTLFFVIMQREAGYLLSHLSLERSSLIDYQYPKKIYRDMHDFLVITQEQACLKKNALRLYNRNDHCDQAITRIFSSNPELGIHALADAVAFTKVYKDEPYALLIFNDEQSPAPRENNASPKPI